MGASQIPPVAASAAASDNWALIASTNPAATSLNFTGISGYKKLMIFWNGTGQNGLTIKINSDSGSKYSYASTRIISSSGLSIGDYPPNLTTNWTPLSGGDYCKFVIDSADTSTMKTSEYYLAISSQTVLGTGIYQATASVSSVNLAWSSSFSTTVYLYGVLA